MVKRIPGRPRKGGPRYACGKRKNVGDVRAPTLWRRIKDHGVRLGIDPRLGAELGRLSLHGELTDSQVSIGLKIAAIYGSYDRLVLGRRRALASPSYIMAYGRPDASERSDPLDEARMATAELKRLERRIDRAKGEFERVQSGIPSAGARAVVECVCVEDRAINSSHLNDLRILLDRVGTLLGWTAAASIAITATKPRRSAAKPKAHVYRAPGDKSAGDAHRSDPRAAADRAETVRRLEQRRGGGSDARTPGEPARPRERGEGQP